MKETKLASCGGSCGVQIPTDEEVTALDAMRAIKGEVKTLRGRIELLRSMDDESSSEERAELERKMDRFRMEWREWEEKRRAAATRRMVLLGHEEP